VLPRETKYTRGPTKPQPEAQISDRHFPRKVPQLKISIRFKSGFREDTFDVFDVFRSGSGLLRRAFHFAWSGSTTDQFRVGSPTFRLMKYIREERIALGTNRTEHEEEGVDRKEE